MRKLLYVLICAVILAIVFDNRYRILNVMLGQDRLRHYIIHTFMRLPFFRNRFIEQAF